MEFPGTKPLLTALVLSTLLTACGGGGGGGGGGNDNDRGAQPTPLTTLPAFLQDATAECTATVNGQDETSLVDFRGSLASITGIQCEGATLTNLSEIEQLSALQALSVPDAGLTSVDELLPLASRLTSLNVGENALANLTTIAQLTALEHLDLSGLDLTDISALSALVNLQTLDLSDNRLTDLTALAGLQHLELVILSDNRSLDCAEVYDLRNALETVDRVDVVVPPSQCGRSINLTDSSAPLRTIDNSQESPRLDRVVITGEYDFDDLAFEKSGNTLSLTLTSQSGERTLAFTDWFVDANHQVQRFVMPDGEVHFFSEISRHVVMRETLGSGDDVFVDPSGLGIDDIVDGGTGNDNLDGRRGNDTLLGGEGNDILRGGMGTDHLTGGPGDDIVIGDNCTVSAEAVITCGSHASDSTNNYFYFNPGDGHDTFVSANYTTDVIRMGEGIDASQLEFVKNGRDLRIAISSSESITLFQYFESPNDRFPPASQDLFIEFHDNAPVALQQLILPAGLSGTEGNDTLFGNDGNNQFYGMDGNDLLRGNAGNDTLDGGAGIDIIIGGDGTDVLNGGPGNDILAGSSPTINATTGAIANLNSDQDVDRYQFSLGGGQDLIVDYDSARYSGILEFGAGITPDNISFQRTGNNLVIQISATDSVTVYNWFSNSYYRLSQFIFPGQDPVDATTFVNARLPQ